MNSCNPGIKPWWRERSLWMVVAIAGATVAGLCLMCLAWFSIDPIHLPRRALEKRDLAALEKAIGFGIHDIENIKDIAMSHGQDFTLVLQIRMPERDVEQTIKAVARTASPTDTAYISRSRRGLPWYRLPREKVKVAFRDNNARRVAFSYPDGEETTILVEMPWSSLAAPSDVLEIFFDPP